MSERFQDLTRILFARDEPASVGGRLTRGAIHTFALRAAYTGLSFVISLLLARGLGTTGYGIYSYSLAWIVLLAVPATLGMDIFLTREVAAFQVASTWGLMRGLLRQAGFTVFIFSGGLALTAFTVFCVLARRADPQVAGAFSLAVVLLPLLSLTRVQQGVLQGLQRVGHAQLPAMLVHPALLAGLLAAALLFLRTKLTVTVAMGMNVLATAIAFLLAVGLVRRSLPSAVKKIAAVYQELPWARSILPLVFILSMVTVFGQTDVLMVGFMLGPKPVGIYSVADRAAEFINLFQLTLNPALAPTFASLFAAKEMKQLQRVVTTSTRMTFLAALLVGFAFIVFGGRILGLFYGPDFARGQRALAILSVGQLINVAAGPVGILLAMTRHERDAAWSLGISTASNLILNWILIPIWGLEGSAVAAAVSLALLNVLSSVRVYRRLGIDSTVLGALGSHRGQRKGVFSSPGTSGTIPRG